MVETIFDRVSEVVSDLPDLDVRALINFYSYYYYYYYYLIFF